MCGVCVCGVCVLCAYSRVCGCEWERQKEGERAPLYIYMYAICTSYESCVYVCVYARRAVSVCIDEWFLVQAADATVDCFVPFKSVWRWCVNMNRQIWMNLLILFIRIKMVAAMHVTTETYYCTCEILHSAWFCCNSPVLIWKRSQWTFPNENPYCLFIFKS